MIDKDWEEKLMQNTISHGTGFMRVSLNKSGGFDVDVIKPEDYRYCIKEPQVAFNSEVVGHVEPQREWVGLTRTELIRCGVLPFGLSYELYEAIETKLKEKNT